jgi:hypothetical protein
LRQKSQDSTDTFPEVTEIAPPAAIAAFSSKVLFFTTKLAWFARMPPPCTALLPAKLTFCKTPVTFIRQSDPLTAELPLKIESLIAMEFDIDIVIIPKASVVL